MDVSCTDQMNKYTTLLIADFLRVLVKMYKTLDRAVLATLLYGPFYILAGLV